MNPTCDDCRQTIPEGVHPFTLRLELFPAIEPSLQISAERLEADFETEMRRLIEQMERMNEGEVIEEEKLMFTARQFTLCPACRNRIADQLDRLGPAGG